MNDARITALRLAVPALSGRDQEPALSLIAQYQRKGSLSDAQWSFVRTLTERGQGLAQPVSRPQATQAAPVDLKPLQDLFDRVADKIKRPRIRLRGGDVDFVIRKAGDESRNPGYLYVMADGEYVAKVDPYGRLQPTRECSREIVNQLRAFSEDPLREAKAYGLKTGYCCFCAKELTDRRSIYHGWGPICASKWGLPWNEVPADFTTEVPA